MNIEQTIADLEKEYQHQVSVKALAHSTMMLIKAKIRKLQAIDKKANEVLGPTAVQDLEKIMDNIE